MPQMGSYLLENIILNYYESKTTCSEFVDMEIPSLLNYISNAIYLPVQDPKGIQGDINNLSSEQKYKISIKATSDYKTSLEAREAETNGEQRKSINKWRSVFGTNFPEYSL
jgi:hypothetical protein